MAEPDVYIAYSLLKLSFFWIGHPTIDWPDYAVFSVDAMRPYFSTLHIVGIFAATLLPLVALAVLIILQAVHGRVHCPAPLLIVCGYFVLVHVITYPELRFSEPLHPILVTMVAAAMKPREYPFVRIPADA